MFMTTREQNYILSILQKTRFMRKDQAVKLLGAAGGARTAEYAARCLEQLRHIRKIKWKTDDVFTLPIMYMEPVDEDMLAAIDIMLDLTDSGTPVLLPAAPPFKLCFLTGREDSPGSYAVITVGPGNEDEVTAALRGAKPDGRTIILLLSELSQKDGVKTALPHFVAVCDGGRHRYFRGVTEM